MGKRKDTLNLSDTLPEDEGQPTSFYLASKPWEPIIEDRRTPGRASRSASRLGSNRGHRVNLHSLKGP